MMEGNQPYPAGDRCLPFIFKPRGPHVPFRFTGDRVKRVPLEGWAILDRPLALELCFDGKRYVASFDTPEAFEMFTVCAREPRRRPCSGEMSCAPSAYSPRTTGNI
jgi:hypothetical protein